ncbi:MAG TPA: hypothetical protein PKC45_04445 [Gemmatales bacterium]|nr:hypothetical protein [Gemmatales bacterium]
MPGTTANDYDRWCQAILAWSTANYAEGDAVYLSVDEQTLHSIRRKHLGGTGGTVAESVAEFQRAVVGQVVNAAERRVDISRAGGNYQGGAPRCLGFLAGLVFAAHQMADDQDADDGTYFIRLCQFFGLPAPSKGYRPAGLELRGSQPAPEEALWQQWNHWLVRRGFQATACRGEGTKYKYSNYPISQAILRKGDKVRLAQWFRECERGGTLTRHCDRDLLAAQLPELASSLKGNRIKKLLLETADIRHFDAIIDAISEVYDALDWDDSSNDEDLLGPRRLRAGLYRTEDFITGAIRYLVYPRIPRRWSGGSLRVVGTDGSQVPLRMQRPGWFMPLWPVELGAERSFEIVGDEELTRLALARRDFWILVHDPDDEASAVMASWAMPGNGQTFLLLCQEQHRRQLQELRDQKLLNWSEVVEVPQGGTTWYEYHECQVESSRWSRILAQAGCEELIHALRPVQRVNIALEGGLRVPGLPVWMEGHQPELRLYQFGGTVELRIARASDLDSSVHQSTATVNEKVPLPALPPGDYVVEAKSGSACATRRLSIAAWSTLGARLAETSFPVTVNGYLLRGASWASTEARPVAQGGD